MYSFVFIARWQREKLGDKDGDSSTRVSFLCVLPSKPVLAALLCALCGGLVSDRCAPSIIVHIAFGCLMFCGFLLVVFVFALSPLVVGFFLVVQSLTPPSVSHADGRRKRT